MGSCRDVSFLWFCRFSWNLNSKTQIHWQKIGMNKKIKKKKRKEMCSLVKFIVSRVLKIEWCKECKQCKVPRCHKRWYGNMNYIEWTFWKRVLFLTVGTILGIMYRCTPPFFFKHWQDCPVNELCARIAPNCFINKYFPGLCVACPWTCLFFLSVILYVCQAQCMLINMYVGVCVCVCVCACEWVSACVLVVYSLHGTYFLLLFCY